MLQAIHHLIYLGLHLDETITMLVSQCGKWVYLFTFIIIFLETAVLVAALLPGDALLLAMGAVAASTKSFNIHILFALLFLACFMGSSLNFLFGKWVGPKVFRIKESWLFNQKNLERTHHVYEHYGSKIILISFFIPIIRTFASFIAGVANMRHKRFFLYNFLGTFLWIGGLLYIGYLFGNIPGVKQHFSLIIILIVLISVLPIFIRFFKQWASQKI